MNAKQRHKAVRAFRMLKDIATINLKLDVGTHTDMEIFFAGDTFLTKTHAPIGSYWPHLKGRARERYLPYIRERLKNGEDS